MCSQVCREISGLFFSARDTVLIVIPVAFATSYSVARPEDLPIGSAAFLL
jgi:hypothetical protein